MDPERVGSRVEDALGQFVERGLRILVIDADPALDRHRNRDRRLHRRHAGSDQRRLAHEAGTERPGLDPVGRAADIEVDLVIAEIGADLRRFAEPPRLRAAELQGHRMLRRRETEQPLPVAADRSLRHDHLGVEQGTPRQLPMQRTAMHVRPVHHRRDGEHLFLVFQGFVIHSRKIAWFRPSSAPVHGPTIRYGRSRAKQGAVARSSGWPPDLPAIA